ncbi:glycosyltransferase family 9 protein [Parapedobacter sp. ISTM3]|uniref:glycosyltransferase family 9 protein n=1 Tax=Parapedobacter sp. ISTM3 TaxID=2800130 RepID=UPI0019079B63|nr:glycosyltransferase family 9 protein [Parapedobacter sp. ISTM3]MBK1441562.1 glycosyltransferase family 9 protein [Parapedobacter sp. ISTM3]
MDNWNSCTNLLIIRPDNIGDVLMSSPAIRAIKRSFGCKITLLTSEAGAAASALLPEVDETLVANFPWVKHTSSIHPAYLSKMVSRLKNAAFDGCVIFTVYSQNPLPTAMLAWAAGIPRRLAYCRENPYDLLTRWVPDDEPYSHIRHQVVRDLDLVEQIGAYTNDDRITIAVPAEAHIRAMAKLARIGVDTRQPFVIFHAGVSEPKRAFPVDRWMELTKRVLAAHPAKQIVFTGNSDERALTDCLSRASGPGTFSAGGLLDIAEFAAVIRQATLVVSVNTATIHLAAAFGRPLVVLYALTNPQHTPWRCPHTLFPYSITDKSLQSRNEVIRHVDRSLYQEKIDLPATEAISNAIDMVLNRQGEGQLAC